eukprot:54838-Eustigmatos_ZCMA.PRE.1
MVLCGGQYEGCVPRYSCRRSCEQRGQRVYFEVCCCGAPRGALLEAGFPHAQGGRGTCWERIGNSGACIIDGGPGVNNSRGDEAGIA